MNEVDKMSIDGATKYESGLHELLRHSDMRAQHTIGIYTGLAGAGLLVAAGRWDSIPTTTGAQFLFISYVTSLLAGVVFAYLACQKVRVAPASRSADFWIWARRNPDDWVAAFLERSEERARAHERAQSKAASHLEASRSFGLLAILIGAGGSLGVFLKWI